MSYVIALSVLYHFTHEQLKANFVSHQMLCELHLKHMQAACESSVIPIFTPLFKTLPIYFQCYPYASAM